MIGGGGLSASNSSSAAASGRQDNQSSTQFGGDINLGAGSGGGVNVWLIVGLAVVLLFGGFFLLRKRS